MKVVMKKPRGTGKKSKLTERESRHITLVHKGKFLPDPDTSSLCNLTFYRKIEGGTLWCPNVQELKLRACNKPPPAKELKAFLIEYLRDVK